MALAVKTLVRTFSYSGVELPDPGAQFSPEQVKGFYAPVYPELNNAQVHGPDTRGSKLIYTFKRNVETKG